jgi:hypothetical protein
MISCLEPILEILKNHTHRPNSFIIGSPSFSSNAVNLSVDYIGLINTHNQEKKALVPKFIRTVENMIDEIIYYKLDDISKDEIKKRFYDKLFAILCELAKLAVLEYTLIIAVPHLRNMCYEIPEQTRFNEVSYLGCMTFLNLTDDEHNCLKIKDQKNAEILTLVRMYLNVINIIIIMNKNHDNRQSIYFLELEKILKAFDERISDYINLLICL